MALSLGCMTNQLFAYSEEVAMQEICEIPEDLSAFEAWLYNRFGGEISGSDVEDLKREMEVFEERETIDPLYSRTEKVRYTLLKKACIAPDKVPYDFYVGVIVDLGGGAVLSEGYLFYRKEDVLKGKRDFYFYNIRGGIEDINEILSKKTVGMNRKQLEGYMKSLGCSRLEGYIGSASLAFIYKMDLKKSISRLAAYDYRPTIQVHLDSEDIVEKVVFKF